MIPTIEWHNRQVRMIDQRKLPATIEWYVCRGYRDVIKAIEKMVIRGAPAIGVAAAMGLASGALSIRAKSYALFARQFQEMCEEMFQARPTAVNLRWAIERMSRVAADMKDHAVEEIKQRLFEESNQILAEDIETNRAIGRYGQTIVPKGATILTHCNAGSLATGGYGTALGVIRAAHEMGKEIEVIADETRPWLQGLRLTAFELMEEGIPVSVIADSGAGFLMQQKKIDLVITGADRIASNGDVANKIGTYQVAVLAKENHIPFYVAAPVSTIDRRIKSGDLIPVEERDPDEIIRFGKKRIGPPNVRAYNPAFDITPAKYVTAILTEKGIVRPPFNKGIKDLP
ncbi:MAG: S-methyl-5-thioribose-1-phosphate isomerase [Desulfatiglans sp.]|jgi:methylthioribose-1-phosphate isomerase|nr:S-methyl-5-thioribose-1-phosphate isomerase [Thermodesulfobacteriota bacterium]MEE4351584.1 S-methyl-5-thioribose-1-phosphate isomerase [Desulfatiglans sp.]